MILDAHGVTKIFSKRGKKQMIANDNLTFSIKEGEIFGLLGHNGAGKTTLVHQVLGLDTPTSGEIFLLGKSVKEFPSRARVLCSVQPQAQVPLGFLTPAQAVSIMGQMRSGKKAEIKRRMEMLFEALDMGEWVNTEGERLSGGVHRLTAFCMAVIVPGRLVILDEPTNDIDPIRRRYLWQVIRELTNDGTSVILVTHNVLEAEKAVDRVAILDKGKFLAQGTPSEVKRSVSNQMRIEANLLANFSDSQIPKWALSPHRNRSRLLFQVASDTVPATIEWARAQVDSGTILDYSLSPTTLEDAYVELINGEGLFSV